MTAPVYLTVVIDDQSIDISAPAPAVSLAPTAHPLASVAVESPAVDIAVSAPAVDVSTFAQPFTVITVDGPAGQTGPPGNGVFVAREIPSGAIDGTRTTFTLASNFQPGSTSVYLNGLLEYFCNELSPNKIQFSDPPHPGDAVRVSYTVSS